MPRTLRFMNLEDEGNTLDADKLPITELTAMGYIGDGKALIERIGVDNVKAVIDLVKEREAKGTESSEKNTQCWWIA